MLAIGELKYRFAFQKQMEEIPIKQKLHIFVCTNDRNPLLGNTMPSCGPRITDADVKMLKEWIRSLGLASSVFCTKTKCLGFCNEEGGVIALYPKGKFYKGFQNGEEIKKFLEKEMVRMM